MIYQCLVVICVFDLHFTLEWHFLRRNDQVYIIVPRCTTFTTKVLGSAPENNNHRSPLRTIFSSLYHRPSIDRKSDDSRVTFWGQAIIGRWSGDLSPMENHECIYYVIMQAYYKCILNYKQVILCNFINVIIVMKTSLIRQPFFYKKKSCFFTFIHVVRISFDLFSPFTISKYNSTLTPDEQARFDRFQIVAFFQNRPTVCRSSPDALPMRKSRKKEDRSTKLLTSLFRQRNRRPTKASSKIGGNIGRQSTVSLQKTPLLIFAHRKSGDCRLG